MSGTDETLNLQADAAVADELEQEAARKDAANAVAASERYAVQTGDVAGAAEASRLRERLGVAGIPSAEDPTVNVASADTGGRGLNAAPALFEGTSLDRQTLDEQTNRTLSETAPGQGLEAQGDAWPGSLPPPTTGKGGVAPNDTTITRNVLQSDLATSLENQAALQEEHSRQALADLHRINGATEDEIAAFDATMNQEGLSPERMYAELEREYDSAKKRMAELDNYFRDLSTRSVDGTRLFQNGGGATASFAVAVGALSQAMLGPGAPNTALNIIENAVERDIRVQQLNLENARASGVEIRNTLSAAMNILKDKQAALSATRAMLREEAIARVQMGTSLSNSRVAQENLQQVIFNANQSNALERAKADGRLTQVARQTTLRKELTNNNTRKLQAVMQAAVDATPTPGMSAPAGVPAQAAPQVGGISPADVAGAPGAAPAVPAVKRPKKGGKGAGGQLGAAVGAGTPAGAGAAELPKERPVEIGQEFVMPDATGRPSKFVAVRDYVTGQVLPARPLKKLDPYSAYVVEGEAGRRFQKFHDAFNLKDSSKQAIYDRVVNTPRIATTVRDKLKDVVAHIRAYAKRNPGRTLNFGAQYADPDAIEIRNLIAKAAPSSVKEYKAEANMTDALSELENQLALGYLQQLREAVLNSDKLKELATELESRANGMYERSKSEIANYGLNFPPPRNRNQQDVDDAAMKLAAGSKVGLQ